MTKPKPTGRPIGGAGGRSYQLYLPAYHVRLLAVVQARLEAVEEGRVSMSSTWQRGLEMLGEALGVDLDRV